jgi:hypothetical protein
VYVYCTARFFHVGDRIIALLAPDRAPCMQQEVRQTCGTKKGPTQRQPRHEHNNNNRRTKQNHTYPRVTQSAGVYGQGNQSFPRHNSCTVSQLLLKHAAVHAQIALLHACMQNVCVPIIIHCHHTARCSIVYFFQFFKFHSTSETLITHAHSFL